MPSSKLNSISHQNIQYRTVSFNDIAPILDDAQDYYQADKIKVSPREAWALIWPYVRVRITEQLKAVVPLAAYLMLFQLLVLRHPIDAALPLFFGLIAVVIGLAVFMEGLNTGLMPFGTLIGDKLPCES